MDEIDKAVQLLLKMLDKTRVIAFHAEMGAGKTTLVSALLKQLGSADVVGSPTFSIINQYQTSNGQTIYHMDWYRLKDEEEAIEAGVEDALYSGQLCLVEWPERAAGLLPPNALHLAIETTGENQRKLRIEA